MKEAMKSGDDLRKRTIRMVLAAIKQVEVDKRIELDDTTVTALIQKEVKNRREALEEAKKANREDLDCRIAISVDWCLHCVAEVFGFIARVPAVA